MKEAIHAEWTKLRTVSGTWWLLLAAFVLTLGLSAASAAAVSCSYAGCHQDPVKISLTGTTLGQAIVAILAVSVIGGEYATGMIRTTLVAVPRRSIALAAKAVTLAAVVVAAALPAVLGSVLLGRLLLPGSGFTAAHGFSALSLTDASTLRAAAGSVLYLALIALFSLGVATLVRDPAVATGVVLALLYLSPVLVHLVANPHWQRHLEQLSPMNAGLAIQNTTDLRGLPISPWSGLGVLAAWAVFALAAAGLALRVRDA
jgi:ABC-2 type transport system permease protein